jgi:hypothetical protein
MDRALWVSGKVCSYVGGFAVAGVLLVGAVIAQVLASFTDRQSRRGEGAHMRKMDVVTSSIMVVASNTMISVASAVASTGSRCIAL